MEYDYDTGENKKIIDKSSGKKWVEAKQNISIYGCDIDMEPNDYGYTMKVISSDTDNPKGSITYKGQELVKE